MTEEEKEQRREVKKEVSEHLRNENLDRYHLRKIDIRLDLYVHECVDHPERHNVFELLEVARFLRKANTYGLNRTRILQFFTLYEGLYFPGTSGDRTYELTPVQAFQFANIYGFWVGDSRLTRTAVLYVPRKFAKTTSTASIAVNDVLFGDSNAEAYVAANSEYQAGRCFSVIKGCFTHLDPSGRRYRVNENIVRSRRKDRSAFAQCLTAGARTKDGLNASTVIVDEYSQARDAELKSTLTTSMGVRKNPLTVIITTASDKFDGPFYQDLNSYKAVLLGEYDDDSLFAHIFEPDVDDEEGDPATWHKVHPHLGITVYESYYVSEWAKARRNAEDMLAFRTKLLNIYAENVMKSWLSSDLARKLSRNLRLEDVKGKPDAMAAIDLSESDDFSSVSVSWYVRSEKVFYFHTAYFFPQGALADHPNEAMYRVWAEKGHLILTPGEVIDYRTIVTYVLGIGRFLRLLRIGYDPYKSIECVNMLGAAGGQEALTPVSQTYGNFMAPTQSFEHGAKTGRIFINDNPINAYCWGNAILDKDRLENCKPIKRSDNLKIDGLITQLMCMRLFIDFRR